MASPAQIIRSCLIDGGLVIMPAGQLQVPGDGSTPCFVGGLPDDYDQAVRIMDVGGRIYGKVPYANKELVHPGLSFLVRSLNPGLAYTLANSIAVYLDQLRRAVTTLPEDGSVHNIQNVSRTTSLIDLGEDVLRKRQMYSFNARVSFGDMDPINA